MARTRLQIAKAQIDKHFDAYVHSVFKPSEVASILNENRGSWGLAQATNAAQFIEFLTEHSKLRSLIFPFPYRKEIRYVWGDVPLLQVLLTLKSDAYYTHYTAVRMHGLTEQIPKTIYLNHEQRPHAVTGVLQQERIDAAFRRPQRVSKNLIEYGDIRICLINGMWTGQLGVVDEKLVYDAQPLEVRVTNLERTLIDITVRPIYAGGVFEVLKAYTLAKDRVSANRLSALIEKLGYVYPYHQAVGFYMDRAGYKKSALDLLRRFPMDFDFYLTHNMRDTAYDKKWRLFIPNGI